MILKREFEDGGK